MVLKMFKIGQIYTKNVTKSVVKTSLSWTPSRLFKPNLARIKLKVDLKGFVDDLAKPCSRSKCPPTENFRNLGYGK
jgi:hypothetical protein